MKPEMTPELEAECDAVFAYWKREGLHDEALAACLLSERCENETLRALASGKFQRMYDAAVAALGLKPVFPAANEPKPTHVWRNGARVKVT